MSLYDEIKQSVNSGGATGSSTYDRIKQSVNNGTYQYTSGLSNAAQTAINSYKTTFEGYDWLQDYTYDQWSDEDMARQTAGQMPLYVYNKYDFDDPDDTALYELGLPPKKLIESAAKKAEAAREKAEKETEEAQYSEWREQAEQAKSGYAEPIVTKSEDGSITFTETGKHTEASEGNGWFGALTSGMKNAKFDNSGVQSRWDRMIWEMQNMQTPTTKELQPYVDALVAGGEYKNEKEATEAAKDQYRKEQEQKWLEYVGAPKDAEGNFLYGSKYAYEGRVVADEMTRAAQESEDFKTMDQLNAEHADDLNYGWDDIYKSTEATSRSSAPIYDHMTDEQKAAYFYYKERGYGDEYLDALTPELTEKAAAATKEYWTEEFPIVGDVALAITGGLESGIKGLIRLVKDDYVARTEGVSSQAAQENRQELAQSDDFWSKAAGLGLDILYSTGNMAPSMLVGAVNPLAGAVAIGASSAGNARVEARNEGATEEQAVLYGLMSGTAEAVMQYLLGGIGKLGGVVTKKSFSKSLTGALSKVLKNPKVVNAFAQHISGALSEALEEYVTGLIDPILRNIALNENNVLHLLDGDALYGALLGAFTGGLLGGGSDSVPISERKISPLQAGDTVQMSDGSNGTIVNATNDPLMGEMYKVERSAPDGTISTEWVAKENVNDTRTLFSDEEMGVEPGMSEQYEKYVRSIYQGMPVERASIVYRPYVEERLVSDLADLGVDVSDGKHAIKSNDVKHLRKQRGIEKAGAYGITDGDVVAIPYITHNYTNVYFQRRDNGDTGIVYRLDDNDSTYYVEEILEGKTLTGRQMIKVPFGEIPDVKSIREAIANAEEIRAQKNTEPNRLPVNAQDRPMLDGDTVPGAYVRNATDSTPTDSIAFNNAESNTQNEFETAIAEYNAEEEAMARLEREGREMEQWISEGYSEKTAREIVENASGATLPVVLAQEETGSALLPAEQANKLADSVTELSARGVRPTKTLDQNLDYAAHNNRKLRNVLHDVFVKDWREGQRREATNRVQTVDRYLKEAERIGIERGSLEEQATMWYGQGYKAVQNESGKWVPQPYGIRDLMKDCPDTWKKVVEFDRVNREIYDRYARDLTEMYKRIYPNVEERASRQLESAAARSQQREADYEAAQNRVRELETQLVEAETALSNKARTDTKAFETIQNRVNRLERLLTEAQQNMLRRKDLADEANVLLMNLDHSVKDGSFYQGKRFFPRANYYAHMMSDSDKGVIEAINELRSGGKGISPQLAGKSEFTKPKVRFAGFTQRRTGVYSELSTIDAMLKYIDIAEYKLAYDPVVAKAREATEVIRQSAAMSPGTEEKTTVQNLEPLLDYLDQWANKLAGKTVREDRTLMGYVSRAGLKLVKAINSRVKANAIVGNAMSAVAQVCNIPVAASYVSNPADWIGGATLMTRAHHGNGGEAKAAFDNSPIMQQRYLERRLRQVNPESNSAMQKLTNVMLEGGDLVSSELMWYSAYNMYNRLDGDIGSKFTRDYESAADFADDVVQRSVAARGAGDIPLTQQSELIKLLAPLQIEVNNQWQTLKSQLSKKTTGSRNIKSIVAMSVATYLLNELLELATGDRKAGFDFVQAFVDMYELFADDEGTVGSDVAGAAGRLGGEVLSGVPGGAYFGMLLTGGDDTTAEKLFGDADPTRYGVGNMGISALADPIISLIQGGTVDPLAVASNIVLPYGGKQVKRMVETAQNQGWIPDVQFSMEEGFTTRQAETPTSYSGTGRVRFAAEDDPLSILQSMLFGQYSTSAGRAYISGDTKLLSEKNSETYNKLATAGMDGQEIIDQLMALAEYKSIKDAEGKEVTSAADQKRAHIEDAGLTVSQQMLLMGSIDESFTNNAAAAKELGISNEQFLEYEYARVRMSAEIQEYREAHDGASPKGGKGALLMDWLKTQDLTEQQAAFLYELHNDAGIFIPGEWKGWD